MPRGSVLIVEDEHLLGSNLQEYLRRRGWDAQLARTGEHALAEYERTRPCVVLMDYQLPDMDGLAFLEQLRAQQHDMPVILMTAYGSLKTAVDGIKAGAFDYLSKPFIIDEVRLVARRALEHKYLSRQNQVRGGPDRVSRAMSSAKRAALAK